MVNKLVGSFSRNFWIVKKSIKMMSHKFTLVQNFILFWLYLSSLSCNIIFKRNIILLVDFSEMTTNFRTICTTSLCSYKIRCFKLALLTYLQAMFTQKWYAHKKYILSLYLFLDFKIYRCTFFYRETFINRLIWPLWK